MRTEKEIRDKIMNLRRNLDLAKKTRHTDGAVHWLNVAIENLEWVLEGKLQ